MVELRLLDLQQDRLAVGIEHERVVGRAFEPGQDRASGPDGDVGDEHVPILLVIGVEREALEAALHAGFPNAIRYVERIAHERVALEHPDAPLLLADVDPALRVVSKIGQRTETRLAEDLLQPHLSTGLGKEGEQQKEEQGNYFHS